MMAHETANDQMSARQSMGPKIGGSLITQPIFNWDTEDKYSEVKNCRLEVNTVFKQEQYETSKGLFHTLNSKFKPQYNERIVKVQ